jgi:hypothetical protein
MNDEETNVIDPRRCGHSHEDGTRCKGWKVSESNYCAGHSGLGVAASPEAAAAAARQSAEVRQEKARVAKKRAIDVYRDAVEAHAQSFVDARLQIINDPTAPAGDRLRAMEQLESRAMGKPKETVEQVNEEPEATQWLRQMTPEERRALMHRLYDEPDQDAAAEAEDEAAEAGG